MSKEEQAFRPGTGPEGERVNAAAIAVAPEDAPRPTAEELPAVEHYFGENAELAQRYVGHLASSGIERGLLGPREIPRLWGRHVLNCAAAGDASPEGALVAEGSAEAPEIETVPAYRVTAVDTTGAGDAFVGATAAELARGRSLSEAVRFATAVSAVAVQRVGAQSSYADRAEVEEFIAARA